MERTARIVESHAELRAIDLQERARMSQEERLAVGAALHAFWVRNFFPDARRLDRSVQVIRRSSR